MPEDDHFVIEGPAPHQPLVLVSLGKLIYESLLENASKGQAMVDAVTGESISYQQILTQSCSLAEALRRNGYNSNTIISISSENNLQFFIPVLAAFYIGAIVAPINHSYTMHELLHPLNLYRPKVLFCSQEVYRKFDSLRSTTAKFVDRIIVIDVEEFSYKDNVETMNHFIVNSLNGVWLSKFVPVEVDPKEQVALIMLSSGTTGLPKGVMWTHSNILPRYFQSFDPRYMIQSKAILGVLPFFHGYGLVTTLFGIAKGEKIVVLKRFEERPFLKAIQDYKISTLFLAPPLILFLSKSPLVEQYDLSSVVDLVSGAAPLRKETEEAVKNRLKVKSVRQGYGLTEASLAVTLIHVGSSRSGSSGKIMSYTTCKVRDPETGKSLGPNQIGEICINGPKIMKGYYNNPEATRNSFTSDGWLLTGDLGYYDEDQYFYIVDRLKELIKYKGYQVAPAELEGVILTHPGVDDVGVVGIHDEEAGELPMAFVVKKHGEAITEKDLQDFVSEKVSSQKRLRGGVIFVDTIPKNPSGKILRRELRIMSKKQQSKL